MRKSLLPLGLILFAATTAFSQSAASVPIQPQAQTPAPAATLVPYSSASGRFSVNFPAGSVEPSTQQVPLNGGGTVTQYVFSVEADNGNTAYMVSYVDYSAAITGPADALVRARDGFSGAVKCNVTSDVAFDLSGVPARAFTCVNSDFHFSAHSFVQGNRLYQILVVSKPDHPGTYTDEFLNSFSIT